MPDNAVDASDVVDVSKAIDVSEPIDQGANAVALDPEVIGDHSQNKFNAKNCTACPNVHAGKIQLDNDLIREVIYSSELDREPRINAYRKNYKKDFCELRDQVNRAVVLHSSTNNQKIPLIHFDGHGPGFVKLRHWNNVTYNDTLRDLAGSLIHHQLVQAKLASKICWVAPQLSLGCKYNPHNSNMPDHGRNDKYAVHKGLDTSVLFSSKKMIHEIFTSLELQPPSFYLLSGHSAGGPPCLSHAYHLMSESIPIETGEPIPSKLDRSIPAQKDEPAAVETSPPKPVKGILLFDPHFKTKGFINSIIHIMELEFYKLNLLISKKASDIEAQKVIIRSGLKIYGAFGANYAGKGNDCIKTVMHMIRSRTKKANWHIQLIQEWQKNFRFRIYNQAVTRRSEPIQGKKLEGFKHNAMLINGKAAYSDRLENFHPSNGYQSAMETDKVTDESHYVDALNFWLSRNDE